MPEVVNEKVQAYLCPEMVKQLKNFLGLLGVLAGVHTPLGNHNVASLWSDKVGCNGGLDLPHSRMEEAFMAAKRAVAQTQTVWVANPTFPYLKTVQVQEEGFGWGLWQTHGARKVPLSFWSELWKGAEQKYSSIETQLVDIYAALVACEAITGVSPVIVQFVYPMRAGCNHGSRHPGQGWPKLPH